MQSLLEYTLSMYHAHFSYSCMDVRERLYFCVTFVVLGYLVRRLTALTMHRPIC